MESFLIKILPMEIATGCALPRRRALVLAQLGRVEGDSGRRAGCSQCKRQSVSRTTLYICLHFLIFQRLEFCYPFLPAVFRLICECFNFRSFKLNMKMNKKSITYLHGFDFSQLPLTEGTEFENLCRATPDLVIFRTT
jgi:hypothetical protein